MLVESEEQPYSVELREKQLPAPWQHTLLLTVMLVLWAIYGVLRARDANAQMALPVRYISGIVMEWLAVGTTIAGLYTRRSFILSVLGLSDLMKFWKDWVIALAILLSGWLALIVAHLALRYTPLRVTSPNDAIKSLAPHTAPEMALWVFVAMTAGICEEFIFRGYLQRQISEWSGSTLTGILIPSLIFGSLHLYQGIGSAIGITVLGFVYAVFVTRLGNLRSVMIAHAFQDLLTGLILYLRHH